VAVSLQAPPASFRLFKQPSREHHVSVRDGGADHGVRTLKPHRLVIGRNGAAILLRRLAGLEEQRLAFVRPARDVGS
jgi:hypothetical protein